MTSEEILAVIATNSSYWTRDEWDGVSARLSRTAIRAAGRFLRSQEPPFDVQRVTASYKGDLVLSSESDGQYEEIRFFSSGGAARLVSREGLGTQSKPVSCN